MVHSLGLILQLRVLALHLLLSFRVKVHLSLSAGLFVSIHPKLDGLLLLLALHNQTVILTSQLFEFIQEVLSVVMVLVLSESSFLVLGRVTHRILLFHEVGGGEGKARGLLRFLHSWVEKINEIPLIRTRGLRMSVLIMNSQMKVHWRRLFK